MALYKTGGGGALSETVLWTNSSPTSTQAATTCNLSDSIANYKYIKIYWRSSTLNDTTNNILVSVEELRTMSNTNNRNKLAFATRYSNTNYARPLYYTDDTTLYIGTAYAQGSTTGGNTTVIITKISGLK